MDQKIFIAHWRQRSTVRLMYRAMRTQMMHGLKSGVKRELIALGMAVVMIFLCSVIIKPDPKITFNIPKPKPRVSLINDSPHPEQSISAGFFLPTEHNVNHRANMPTLAYDSEGIDTGSIKIFNVGDGFAILSKLDPFPNILMNNILSSICLSEIKNFSPVNLSTENNIAHLEDLASGESISVSQEHCPKMCQDMSVLVSNRGNMPIVSPNELAAVVLNASAGQQVDEIVEFFRLKCHISNPPGEN
jgi:hypothetical protein